MSGSLLFGSVIAYAGEIDPTTYENNSGDNFSPTASNNTGWILCDGSTIGRGLYDALFQSIGYIYGGQINSGAFSVPDYRSYFLRGLLPGNSGMPANEDRQKAAGDQATQDGVGSTQENMVQMHEHGYTHYPGTSVVQGQQQGTAGTVTSQDSWTKSLYTDDTGSQTLSGSETRPKNIYVNYLIYAGLPNTN